MKKLLFLFSLIIGLQANSQQLNIKNAVDGNRLPVEVTYFGFGLPISDDLDLVPQFQHVISKNESENNEELEIIKKAKMLIKKQYIAEHPELGQVEKGTRIDGPVTPVLVVGYNAINAQGTPPDNTIAVNKADQIVAVVNSSIRYYNATSGAALASSVGLANFFSAMSNPSLASTNLCDPKVIYDAQADRFIVFAQTCDGNSSTSQIVMAFSKTSNPTQGWYYYGFSGNQSAAVGQTGWFDYPKVAVSDHDFFVTGNIFDDNFDYIESVVFQIDKTKCFSGGTLGNGDAVIYSGIDNNPFTMVPISYGQIGGYGTKMYLVATQNGGFNGADTRLNILEISGAVQTGPTISSQILDISNYPSPANAIQKGTSVELMSGDNRGLDGFYINGKIHYVFHGDVGNGYSGVIYHRLMKNASNAWVVDKQQTIKASGKDFSFPSIASMGYNGTDQAAIIGFSYASNNEFPGMKAVFINHDGVQSPTIEIKTGVNYVDLISTNNETRWGDYSSMARVQNAAKPTAWFFSCAGNSTNAWTNHFAKITTAAWPTGTASFEKEDSKPVIYPNPVVEEIAHVKIDLKESGRLEINLLDMNGRNLKAIYKTNASAGENLLSFNKGNLPVGNYIVSISLNNQIIQNEKITVSNK